MTYPSSYSLVHQSILFQDITRFSVAKNLTGRNVPLSYTTITAFAKIFAKVSKYYVQDCIQGKEMFIYKNAVGCRDAGIGYYIVFA